MLDLLARIFAFVYLALIVACALPLLVAYEARRLVTRKRWRIRR